MPQECVINVNTLTPGLSIYPYYSTTIGILTGGVYSFSGYIEDVRLYDYALSRDEVYTVYYSNADRNHEIVEVSCNKSDSNIWVLSGTNIELTQITGSQSNIIADIGEYINSDFDIANDLHPIILGYSTTSNVTTPESISITDIRRRGGGLPTIYDVDELSDDKLRNYFDVAKYDGYDFDLSNMVTINIAAYVKDNLITQVSKFDPYAQRQLRLDPLFNIEAYVESYIESRVKKYIPASCYFNIEYV
jgi:hypothetical protein